MFGMVTFSSDRSTCISYSGMRTLTDVFVPRHLPGHYKRIVGINCRVYISN